MLVITLAVAFTLGLKTLFSLYLCFVYTCSHVPFFFFFFQAVKSELFDSVGVAETTRSACRHQTQEGGANT